MDMMRVVEEIETPYNDIDVWETDTGYDFEVSGGTHATYDRHRLLTGYAWDAITAASMLRPGVDAINLLMLGLGGGTSLRQLRHLLPHCHLTAVDIDPAMVDLAKRYMALDSLNATIIVDDAYSFIDHDETTYDIVIDDVYLGISSGVVRPADYTYELINRLTNRLTPTGVLVTNVITGQGYGRVHRTIREAYCRSFEEILAVTPPFGFNTSFVGGKTLSHPAVIKEMGYRFEHPHDIREWEQLTVRRLTSKKDG
jgi:spermidine synthase